MAGGKKGRRSAAHLAVRVRDETRLKVLRYVCVHGPCTARAIAFGLYGQGQTRTLPRARVHIALTELEGLGQVSRRRPALYSAEYADEWTVLN